MSERGFFAVDRGVWDHPVFADEAFSEREAFLWLIGEAAFKPRRARVGSVVVDLERGQVAVSLRYMAARWRWSEPRVRRYLARLKKDGMIDAKTDAGATQLTICNYDRYQGSLEETDAEATQERRKKKNKETIKQEPTEASASVDERAKRKTRIDPNWQPSDSGIASAAKRNVFDPELSRERDRFVSHHTAKGNLMASWDAAWITWLDSPYRATARAGPAPRKTFGQIAREAADNLSGHPHEPQFHSQADAFDGPSLDLVAGDAGASVVDLHSRRAAGAAW